MHDVAEKLARLLADQVALRELATRGRVLAQVLDLLALLVQKVQILTRSGLRSRSSRPRISCPQYAHVCSRMLTYAPYVDVCSRMLTYACADGAAGLGSLAHSAAGMLSEAPPDDIGDNRRAAGSRRYR